MNARRFAHLLFAILLALGASFGAPSLAPLAGTTQADSNSSWTTFSTQTSYLSSVAFPTASEGWAVGWNPETGNSTILHFANETWLDVSNGQIKNVLRSVAFTPDGEGWAVGDSCTILHYNGTIWSPVTSETCGNLNSVAFTPAGDGWAVGKDGTILRYTGGTWSPASSPTGETLRSVAFPTATEGWAVGQGGIVLHYTGAPGRLPSTQRAARSGPSRFHRRPRAGPWAEVARSCTTTAAPGRPSATA